MSTTSWNRLEPIIDGGTAAVNDGLAASTADPLWLLGRQWQIGELTAEDAGTPICAIVQRRAFPIETLQVGSHSRPFDSGTPLEALVEPEPPAPPDLRLQLRAGEYLLRLLEAAGAMRTVGNVITGAAAGAHDDPLAATLLRATGSRALDTERVLQRLGAIADVDALLAGETHADSARAALDRWKTWYLARTGRAAPSAWQPEEACYRFSLGATVEGQNVKLDGEYRGGRLSWSDLSAEGADAVTATTAARVAGASQTEYLLPAPINIPGGPSRRFFEVEDTAVNFNLVAGGAVDVATALLAEVGLLYSNDWFVVPVAAPVGALIRIDSVEVTDCFGEKTILGTRLRSPGWRMFEISGDMQVADLLAVLPTANAAVESHVIEEVVIARDEMANLAWAIPTTRPDPLGLPVQLKHGDVPAVPVPESTASWVHRLLLPAPYGWLPLARQDKFLASATFVDVVQPAPEGHLLSGWPAIRMQAEEVPMDGVRVSRRWQLAVTTSGERMLWVTRELKMGIGGVASNSLADALLRREA